MDDFQEFEEIRKEYERLKFPWEERRAFPRKQDALPIRFMGEEIDSYLFSIDVGGGGIRIVTRKPLDPKKTYEFELMLKELDRPVRVKGKLVWSRPLNIPDEFYETGIMFQEVLAEDQKLVAGYANHDSAVEESERRRYLRVPRLLLVTISQGSEEEAKERAAGLIIDLSEGGARILTSKLFPEKTKVHMKIELEEGNPMEVEGSVMWGNHVEALRKFQHGVEFVHGVKFQAQQEKTKEVIQDYLKFKSQLTEVNLVETLLNIAKKSK